jgi:hypothetical protein
MAAWLRFSHHRGNQWLAPFMLALRPAGKTMVYQVSGRTMVPIILERI